MFPYLVWRRQWAALASMIVFLAVFLFIVPAPVRGFSYSGLLTLILLLAPVTSKSFIYFQF